MHKQTFTSRLWCVSYGKAIIITMAVTAMWDNYLCVVTRDHEASIATTPSLSYFTTPVSIATTASLNYLSTVVSPRHTELQ